MMLPDILPHESIARNNLSDAAEYMQNRGTKTLTILQQHLIIPAQSHTKDNTRNTVQTMYPLLQLRMLTAEVEYVFSASRSTPVKSAPDIQNTMQCAAKIHDN